MAQVREKLPPGDARVLRKGTQAAEQEGRQRQVLVGSANRPHRQAAGRQAPRSVMATYLSSIERFGPLYKKTR